MHASAAFDVDFRWDVNFFATVHGNHITVFTTFDGILRRDARNDGQSVRLWLVFYQLHIFYRQLDFPSEPGVANEILENEAKSCLAVAQFYS